MYDPEWQIKLIYFLEGVSHFEDSGERWAFLLICPDLIRKLLKDIDRSGSTTVFVSRLVRSLIANDEAFDAFLNEVLESDRIGESRKNELKEIMKSLRYDRLSKAAELDYERRRWVEARDKLQDLLQDFPEDQKTEDLLESVKKYGAAQLAIHKNDYSIAIIIFNRLNEEQKRKKGK